MITPYPVDDAFTCAEVSWVRAPVQFVLQRVFDLVFQVVRYVIAMSNVSDSRQRHRLHELVGKRGKVCFDAAYDEAIFLRFKLVIQLLMQPVGNACVVVWPEVALLPATYVPCSDEVQEG